MFGIGKLLGGVVGGVLDKVGLGKIAPFVKLGINAFTGNWMGVAQDVFGLVSGFKGDFQKNASKLPPLGGFGGNPESSSNPGGLLSGKMPSFLEGLKALTGLGSGGDKISGAFNLLDEIFGISQLFSNRQSASQYSSMQA